MLGSDSGFQPDRTFHRFKAWKSTDRRVDLSPKRRSIDLEAPNCERFGRVKRKDFRAIADSRRNRKSLRRSNRKITLSPKKKYVRSSSPSGVG